MNGLHASIPLHAFDGDVDRLACQAVTIKFTASILIQHPQPLFSFLNCVPVTKEAKCWFLLLLMCDHLLSLWIIGPISLLGDVDDIEGTWEVAGRKSHPPPHTKERSCQPVTVYLNMFVFLDPASLFIYLCNLTLTFRSLFSRYPA